MYFIFARPAKSTQCFIFPSRYDVLLKIKLRHKQHSVTHLNLSSKCVLMRTIEWLRHSIYLRWKENSIWRQFRLTKPFEGRQYVMRCFRYYRTNMFIISLSHRGVCEVHYKIDCPSTMWSWLTTNLSSALSVPFDRVFSKYSVTLSESNVDDDDDVRLLR